MNVKKILLTILAIIVIGVVLIFIYGSTQPKVVEMQRSIVIDQDPATVYNYVSNFKTWNEWSAWNLRDSTMKVSYSGNESGAGAEMSWTSENSGNGKQVITDAVPHSEIKTSLDFGDMGTAYSDWMFEKEGRGTKVTWGFKSETGGPFIRGLMALFIDMEEMIAKDYDEGLQNLKNKIESLPRVAISEEDVAGFSYIGVMNTVEDFDMEAIGNAYAESYGAIMAYMEQAGLPVMGPPFAIVHEYTEDKMVFEPAMVVAQTPKNLKMPLQAGEIKACKVVKGVHMGDYSEMEPTYDAVSTYIEEKGYQVAGNAWEVYITDPEVEKDTTKWETHIYFPVSM